MPPAVENRSRVQFTALCAPTDGPSPGWMRCRVRITAAADVDGYPNLLADDLPREMEEALVPAEDAATLATPDSTHERLATLVAPRTLRTIAPKSNSRPPSWLRHAPHPHPIGPKCCDVRDACAETLNPIPDSGGTSFLRSFW